MEQNYDNNEPTNGKRTLWIVGGIILVVMIIAIVYGATQKSLKNSQSVDTSTGPALNTPSSSPSAAGSTSVLGASDRVSVTPTISGMDVVNLKTFPYQVQARVNGTVPDGCSTFDTPTVVQEGKVFTVSVTASKAKDAVCTQVITSQSVVADIPVAGLPAGTYTIKLGKISKKFTLAANNDIQYTNDK